MVDPPATPRKQAPAQVGANAAAGVLAPPPDLARYPSLVGKTVLVTGGASGIGAAMAVLFAEQAARVAILDIADDAARGLVDALRARGTLALGLRCDVTDVAALRRSMLDIEAALGPVDVLVNNAARDDRQELMTASVEYWDEAMAVNLRHHLFATQTVRITTAVPLFVVMPDDRNHRIRKIHAAEDLGADDRVDLHLLKLSMS